MLTKRTFLTSAALLASMSLKSEAAFGIFQVNGGHPSFWQTLKLGAGGLTPYISIQSDGTKVITTDVGGGYVRRAGQSTWTQILTSANPTATPGNLQGLVAANAAPVNTQIIYEFFFNNIQKSSDGGVTWTNLNFPASGSGGTNTISANDNTTKSFGPYLVVDPVNSSVVYMGTPLNGLYRSLDAGATWSQVTAVGKEGSLIGNMIAFDPTSGTTTLSGATVTAGIFVSTWNIGVWHSTDGGATWTLLNGANSSTQNNHPIVDQFGVFWSAIPSGALQYKSSTWTQVLTASTNDTTSVAVDPASGAQATSRVFVLHKNGIYISTNGGGSFVGPAGWTIDVSSVPPWPFFAADGNLDFKNMTFDPSASNTLWIATGTGALRCNPPNSNTTITFTYDSPGMEELVMNWGVKPPGGNLVLAAWDRPIWIVTNPKVYPSRYYPNNNNEIVPCWSIDWCSSDPTTWVAILAGIDSTAPGDISGVLTGNGAVYTQFAGKPSVITNGTGTAGCVAASTPLNFVWMPNNTGPFFTLDGGAHWNPCNTGQSGTGGWATSTGATKHMRLAADRVAANTFYMYNDGSGTNSADKGIYKSTDGGANWTHVYSASALGNVATAPQMRTVLGKTGELFFSPGPEQQSATPFSGQDFQYSQNGGTTWSIVPNTNGAWGFGFGKQIGSYPTIFMYGWARANSGAGAFVLGLWQSSDLGTNWINLSGQYINGSFDYVSFVEGDDQIAGQCYVGFQGTGCQFYGT